MSDFHTPVLLREVIEGLKVKKGLWYVDATAGGGGHTGEILRLGGFVLALDQDEVAIERLKIRFKEEIKEGRLLLVQDNFSNLPEITKRLELRNIYGILLDLGMSTYQIKQSGRGFSFMSDEPLDMRMWQGLQKTAADIVNTYSENDLAYVFTKFGEDVLASKIAQAIVEFRRGQKIQTTGQLGSLVNSVYTLAHRHERIHPATRIFQALRIEVNDELTVLKQVLPFSVDLLSKQGRLVVISFHSLEDRIVKNFFRMSEQSKELLAITKKPIVAGGSERRKNPPSRSAKLRIAEKI